MLSMTPHPTWSSNPGWKPLLHWEDLQIYEQKPGQGATDEAWLSWRDVLCTQLQEFLHRGVHHYHFCVKKQWDNREKMSAICKLFIILSACPAEVRPSDPFNLTNWRGPVLFCRDKTWRKIWVNSIVHTRFCRNNHWPVMLIGCDTVQQHDSAGFVSITHSSSFPFFFSSSSSFPSSSRGLKVQSCYTIINSYWV